ncbi:hypothetical protein AADZ86_08645 [Colwelliaceae bacterium BS250]
MTNLSIQEKNLLQKVKQEPNLRPYFFQKIKNVKWFLAAEAECFFAKEEMPEIIQNTDGSYRFPQWPAIEYLVKASESLSENQELIPNFLSIIRECTIKNIDNRYSNRYLMWNFAKIYKNIPINSFTLADIEIVELWFNNIHDHDLVSDEVAQLLLDTLEQLTPENKEKTLKLLSILFEVKKVEIGTRNQPEVRINLKSHRKDKLVVSIGQKVGSLLGEEGVSILLESLSKATEIIDADHYSSIWRSAIEEHNQNGSYREEEHLLIVVCREAFDAYFKVADDESVVTLLKGLFEHQFSIVKRLAIHTYNMLFQKIGNQIIDELLKPEFFKSNFRHEVWHLLKENYQQLSVAQKQKLLSLIEDGSLRDDGTHSYYYQAEWLLAISDYEKALKEKLDYALKKINGVIPEHPDFTSYTSSGDWRTGESPIPLEQLKETARRSFEELIDTLNNYQPTESTFESGIEELVSCFKQFIIDEAEKIYPELHRFERIKIPFIYVIIQAYSDLWKDSTKTQPNWNEVWPSLLQLIEVIFNNEKFWNKDTEDNDAFIGRKSWLVSSVCRLIEAGCKNDGHSFTIENTELAKNILLNILENQVGNDFSLDSDAVSVSINSNRGQCLEALINLALFECRYSKHVHGEHELVWEKYSETFTKELIEVQSLEFRTLVPMYIRNFKWLSHEWLNKNFESFFTDDLDLACVCSLQGYAHNHYLDPLMYEYLKKHNNFENILEHESLGKKIERRFIMFGLIPYVFNDELLTDQSSLIYKLMHRNDAEEFKEIISFIRVSFAQAESIDKKAIELFPIILNKFDKETLEGKRVISNLVDWAKFLDLNNEQHIGWLVCIAPYAELEHNSHDFIKLIDNISQVEPKYALKVWMSLLTEMPSYPYPEESYINIYKNLLNSGLEREAREIADRYIKFGLQTPADWYRKAKESVNKQS